MAPRKFVGEVFGTCATTQSTETTGAILKNGEKVKNVRLFFGPVPTGYIMMAKLDSIDSISIFQIIPEICLSFQVPVSFKH